MINKLKIENLKISRGFTLVELLIAIALFSLVVSISLGSILSIFDANRRAQSAKTAVDNLNLSLENMARTVRFGSYYYCGEGGALNEAYTCPDNQPNGGSTSLSVTFNGERIKYRLNVASASIEKAVNSGSYTKITAPEMVVQHLKFYVFNTNQSDDFQPYVVAVIKGYVGGKPTLQSSFSIQTVMSQRALDL